MTLDSPANPLGQSQLIESLLFVSAEPVPVHQLARVLSLPLDSVEQALERLRDEYRGRGIRLQRHDDLVQLVSAPEAAPVIERFLGLHVSTPRLSGPALETLAIVAYRQPVTRPGIEAVRGVDCSGALRTLLLRGLVAEVGRVRSAGRPVLYGTTDEFLKQFGLESVAQLPALDENDPPRHAHEE